MGDEVKPPTQPSCIWCLDVEAHSLVCSCKYDCGLPDCPVAEKPFDYRPPVPNFGGPVRKLDSSDRIVPIGVVNIDPEDYGHAINRVVALHKRCTCSSCSTGVQRPICKSCNDFWPCITIRTMRDVNSLLVTEEDSGIASIA
jgi:hypothetical protein